MQGGTRCRIPHEGLVQHLGELLLPENRIVGIACPRRQIDGVAQQVLAGLEFHRIGRIQIGIAACVLQGGVVTAGGGVERQQFTPGVRTGHRRAASAGRFVINGVDSRIHRPGQRVEEIGVGTCQVPEADKPPRPYDFKLDTIFHISFHGH